MTDIELLEDWLLSVDAPVRQALNRVLADLHDLRKVREQQEDELAVLRHIRDTTTHHIANHIEVCKAMQAQFQELSERAGELGKNLYDTRLENEILKKKLERSEADKADYIRRLDRD